MSPPKQPAVKFSDFVEAEAATSDNIKGGNRIMKFDLTDTRIFLKPGVTDLRISTDEILHLIKNIMEKDPLSGAVFLFCNKRRNILKAIWWDRTGFWTAQKKLEKHRWPWPENKEAVNEINSRQMAMLLTGIDFTQMHEELHFEKFA